MSNQVFNDMHEITKAGAAYAKAQATFNAAAKQCGLIMAPLHNAMQAADVALKEAINKTATDEAKTVKVDLSVLLATALAEQATAEAAAALAAQTQAAANE